MEAASQTDAELLAAHVAGDPNAFGELVARHRDRLWAVALRTTGDPEEAQDAVQDALISAFRRADSFRGEAQVTTWLHRIVVNACLDRMRRRQVRPTVPLPEEDGEPSGNRAALADPTDHLDARETAIEIQRALAELPADQRAAIVLVDIEGYPVEQAAEILDCPVGTVEPNSPHGSDIYGTLTSASPSQIRYQRRQHRLRREVRDRSHATALPGRGAAPRRPAEPAS